MKVVCQECSSSFKVKGEVAPGKAFKFKCPKCNYVNRLLADESGSPKPAEASEKASCEVCGTSIIPPDKGGPAFCDQCRASRAVAEARKKSQALIEEKDGEFPDDIFDPIDPTPPPKAPAAPPAAATKTEPVPEETPPPAKPAPEPPAKPAEPPAAMPPLAAAPPKPAEPLPEPKKVESLDVEDARYEIRSKDGLVIGPIKLNTLRDLILAKKVHSDEECRRNDGDWAGMLEFPEVFKIFEIEKVDHVKEKDNLTPEQQRAKLIEELKIKKKCEGCGAEIYTIEDVAHPLCDQCRIEALVTKKRQMADQSEAKYKIRSPDGLVLGPLKLGTIEDLIAAGNIQGHEEICVNEGKWGPIAEVHELAHLLISGNDLIELTETVDG